jgi:hypothetical protein
MASRIERTTIVAICLSYGNVKRRRTAGMNLSTPRVTHGQTVLLILACVIFGYSGITQAQEQHPIQT